MKRMALKRKANISALAWTLFIILIFVLAYFQARKSYIRLARESAFIYYANDIIYRKWAAEHGGMYVPVTNKTRPNEYLKVPHRDVVIDNGRLYTLMNPAYMTRQVQQKKKDEFNLYAHITSLNPINPSNGPDAWEREQFTKLSDSTDEATEFTQMGNEDFVRYFKAFRTEEACLKCHAEQGYKVGDIRGAISVAIPMSHYWASLQADVHKNVLALGGIWILGLGFIFYNFKTMRREIELNLELERNVQEGHLRYKYLFDGASEGIVLHEMDGAILEANKHFLDLSGYAPEELKRLDPRKLVIESEVDAFLEEMEQIRQGQSLTIEHTLRRKDGDTVAIEVSAAAIKNEYIQGLVRDITVRRENEKLKEDIDRILQHDLKSPLNGIIGLSQLLREEHNITSQQKNHLAIMEKAAFRILSQIELSIKLFKIESNTYQYTATRFDIGKLLDEVISEHLGLINLKKIECHTTLPDENARSIATDESLCYSILSNAIKNAIEASPPCGKISIGVRSEEAYVLSIHNEGTVPDQILPRFFDKYTTFGKKTGTGLGTYIIKKFTEAQGGEVSLSSNQDDGTTLTIRLPKPV